ncbi:acetyl-CoA carboxylase, carboxyltransferase subunit beta [Priestia filamentosa]|uniref:acetyl-CoA carboxylase, carboxyltransferase subunit beta n=1 Tax=Priestia filamentosa TaxID=1402861 RepID=UPI003982169D
MFKNLLNKKNIKHTTDNVKSKLIDRIPNGTFDKCPSCKVIKTTKELKKHQFVCPECQFHIPLSAVARIEFLIDSNSFKEFDPKLSSSNPLEFDGYKEKLKQDVKKTKMNEAVKTGEGTINGLPVIIAVMDSNFRMGSMGSVVGEKITRAIEKAIEKRLPIIVFTASGGARMQEGVLSLMQMAKTSAALEQLHREGLLFISYLTHPTTGGVSASFTSLGDINIGEPKATIGFAGRRIIEQTIRQELPKDFQTSEFLLDNGQLDLIIHRKDMKSTLTNILKIHSM